MEKPAQNSRTFLSFGQVRGVLTQRPLVLPELIAADPVKRQVDQPGNRFVASPGAGQGGRKACSWTGAASASASRSAKSTGHGRKRSGG
jgi:hypothetical protein